MQLKVAPVVPGGGVIPTLSIVTSTVSRSVNSSGSLNPVPGQFNRSQCPYIVINKLFKGGVYCNEHSRKKLTLNKSFKR
jgi:hypothetical protein